MIFSHRNAVKAGGPSYREAKGAGLLGWVASPNGGTNSLVLASGCCPVRFDLDHSLSPGVSQRQRTGVSALHEPVLRTLHQSTLYPGAVKAEDLH